MSTSPKTAQIVVLYTTISSREQAKTIARTVVAEHLAACVNIIPGVTSVYAQKTALLAWLEAHHPYAVPVLLNGLVEVNEKFAHFVESTLHTREDSDAR